MTAYMMGQTDLARAALRKAASAAKDFPGKDESKRRLALLESGTGASPELSISQLEAMTKEQPNDVIVQMRLGEAYEKQGAADKAAAAFEQALKLNPKLTAAANQARATQCRTAPEQGESSRLRKESARAGASRSPGRRHSRKGCLPKWQFHLVLQPSAGSRPPARKRSLDPARSGVGGL